MKFPHLADVHVDVDDDATETFSTWHGVFHHEQYNVRFFDEKMNFN